jgi:hypothetical protein
MSYLRYGAHAFCARHLAFNVIHTNMIDTTHPSSTLKACHQASPPLSLTSKDGGLSCGRLSDAGAHDVAHQHLLHLIRLQTCAPQARHARRVRRQEASQGRS